MKHFEKLKDRNKSLIIIKEAVTLRICIQTYWRIIVKSVLHVISEVFKPPGFSCMH